jgi:hypothetical protein
MKVQCEGKSDNHKLPSESTKELVRKKGRKCLHNKNENALQATAKSED